MVVPDSGKRKQHFALGTEEFLAITFKTRFLQGIGEIVKLSEIYFCSIYDL